MLRVALSPLSSAVVLVEPDRPSQRHPLGERTLDLGRRMVNDIVVFDRQVSSGRHCRFLATAHGLDLQDLRSGNGTFVNGRRIDGPQPIHVGDLVVLGGSVRGHFVHTCPELVPSDEEKGRFVADIVAAPDDDAPRLVYADWLCERGRARGELIQLQVALERPLPDEERRLIELRAGELLVGHEARWLGPLDSPVESWRFRRGFIDAVRVDPEGFLAPTFAALLERHPIREVSFVPGTVGPDDLEPIRAAPWFPRLRVEL